MYKSISDILEKLLGVPGCIDKLAQAGIKIWVLTGDKMDRLRIDHLLQSTYTLEDDTKRTFLDLAIGYGSVICWHSPPSQKALVS
ncbi:hypothetical protein ACP70R_001965 [Stipagrostis hirtigluma subsp. patula]